MIQINNNIPKEAVENILNQVSELNTQIGYAVNIYPFKIVSGLTRMTETGEKSLQFKSDGFRNCIDLITSSEPIVCYWEGAYKSIAYFPGSEFQVKKFSADNGKKIKCYITDYNKNIETSSINLGAPGKEASYTYIQMTRNITMFTIEWTPTDDDLRDYLFVVVDKKANSPQLLRAVSSQPIYSPAGKYLGSNVSFVNVNLAYSQSGKDILNFPKLCHPGGNYAYPVEIETDDGIKTILDTDILNNVGVNDIQLFFEGAYSLNSILVIGRPADRERIYAPRRLLLVNPHPPISSALDIVGSATNEYYACFSAKPIFYSLWSNWKEKLEALYNNTAKKTFLGGVSVDYAETEATNPLDEDEYREYNLWNAWHFSPAKEHTYDTSDVWACDTSLTFDENDNLTICDFLNHNSFIYSCYEQLPVEYKEFTKYTLSDFGWLGKILQGFVNFVTGNLLPPIGWLTSSTPVPRKFINLMIPVPVYNNAKTICADSELQPIPYDVFTNSENFTGGGNENVNCGFRAELTDLFLSPSQKNYRSDATIGTGKNGYWNTMYIGQKKFKDGTTFKEASNNEFEMLIWKKDCKAIKNNTQSQVGYEVDFVQYQGIGKANCRMSFNKYLYNNFAKCYSVYESRQQTNALFKDDIKLWRNQTKLNFSEEANNVGELSYPEALFPNGDKHGITYYLFDVDPYITLNSNYSVLQKIFWQAQLTSKQSINENTQTFNIFQRTGLHWDEIVENYPNSKFWFVFQALPDERVPDSQYIIEKEFSVPITDIINNTQSISEVSVYELAEQNNDVGGYPNAIVNDTSGGGSSHILYHSYIPTNQPVGNAYGVTDNTLINSTYAKNSTTPATITITHHTTDNDLFDFDVDNWWKIINKPTATQLSQITSAFDMTRDTDYISHGDYYTPWQNVPANIQDNILYVIVRLPNVYVNITNPESTQQITFGFADGISVISFDLNRTSGEIMGNHVITGGNTRWKATLSLETRDYEGNKQVRLHVWAQFTTPNPSEPKATEARWYANLYLSSKPYSNVGFPKDADGNLISARIYGKVNSHDSGVGFIKEYTSESGYPHTEYDVKIKYALKNCIIELIDENNNEDL